MPSWQMARGRAAGTLMLWQPRASTQWGGRVQLLEAHTGKVAERGWGRKERGGGGVFKGCRVFHLLSKKIVESKCQRNL